MKGLTKTACLGLVLLVLGVSGPPAAIPEEPTAAEAVLGVDGVQRAQIVGGSYFFRPARLIVKVGVPVELTLRKEEGVAPHNLVIRSPEAGVDFSVEMGTEPRTVTFTPTKVGAYPVYCDKRFLFFASHRERGMEGVLEVRE